jgi:hypothetical protein
VETFTPNNQILIFEEQLCMSNMAFLYLILTSPSEGGVMGKEYRKECQNLPEIINIKTK